MVLKADNKNIPGKSGQVFQSPARLHMGLTRAVSSFMQGFYEYAQRACMYQPVGEGVHDVPAFEI